MAIKDKFTLIGDTAIEFEEQQKPTLSYWKDAMRRLFKNKLAVVFMVILLVIIVLTFIGPSISGYGFNEQDYSKLDQVPSAKHWFGTDGLGRDMFTRVWIGARTSLMIGVIGMLVEVFIGCIYGSVAGYFGGLVDNIMMRIIEILASIPYEILVMLLLIVMKPGITSLIIGMCFTGWIGLARMIRAQILQLKESDYVLAAKALGSSPTRIMFKHLLPNTIGTIIVYMTMDIPALIFAEAMLSYLGMGIQTPNVSWGSLISDAQSKFLYYPHELLFTVAVLCLTVLAFNLIGEGLRDALDPKLRQ